MRLHTILFILVGAYLAIPFFFGIFTAVDSANTDTSFHAYPNANSYFSAAIIQDLFTYHQPVNIRGFASAKG